MNRRDSRPGSEPGAGLSDPAVEALFAQALARHQTGDLGEAERLYRRLLAAAPDHVDGLHFLGLVRAQSGAMEDAVRLMGRAVALRPDFALAHYNLGNALRRLGRGEAAVEAYGEAIRLQPRSPAALTNLGVTLRDLGRTEEAVEAYGQALAFEPANVQAHYNLGVALQALGRIEEAVHAYRRTLNLKPDHADALANLGVALLALGRQPEALEACQRRLVLEPNAAEAHTALASALLALGRAEEAAEASRRGVALAPTSAEAHIHLAAALREMGRDAEALAVSERAVHLNPEAAAGWVNLAIARQEAGQGEAAIAAIDEALTRDPRSAAAWAVRADLKTFKAGDPDLAALRALVASADSPSDGLESRLDLEFALGKALMDVGDAEGAFAHFQAGNRLKRATLSYDVQEDEARFAEIARFLDSARLAGPTGGGDPSDQPVFIVGMPRSGTTLVEQILASHPKVHGAGELPTLEAILIRRLGPELSPLARVRRLPSLKSTDLTDMGSDYARRLAALAPGAARIVDKMPSNFRWVGLIRLMLPRARIIHCRRDPIDTCLSAYTRKFSHGQPFAYDLGELGRYYRAYDALMAHWRGLLDADHFLEVGYEAVVADLEGEARRLVAFCGLEWDEACLAFHQTRRAVRTASVNQVRRPLYRTSVARWKPYEAQLGPLLEALSGGAKAQGGA
jgi:tetratricopeptide (TPR) repeat protein